MHRKKNKLLIIGIGSIGIRHLLNTLGKIEVGIYDKDISKAYKISKNYKIKYFNNFKSINNWSPNAMIIASPSSTHKKYLQLGIKLNVHILVEKPISNSLTGLKKLMNKIKKKKLKVFVVTNMRYHDGIITIKKNLKKIGKLFFARAYVGHFLPNMRPNVDYRKTYAAQKKKGGNLILDFIHEIDYLNWLFGRSKLINVTNKKLSNLKIDVNDYSNLQLKHSKNFFSNINLDYLQKCSRRGCEIVGSKGTIIWTLENKQPEKNIVKIYINNNWKNLYVSNNYDKNKPYKKQLENFFNAIDGKKHQLCSLQEGYNTLKLAIEASKF